MYAFKEKNYPTPILTETLGIDRTTLTLILKDKSKEIGSGTINGTIKDLPETILAVYNEIQRNLYISKPQIAKNLGIGTTSVSRAINDLKSANLLLGKTSNKGGR